MGVRVQRVARWLIVQGSLELAVALVVGVGWALLLGQTVSGELGGFQRVAFLGMSVCSLLGGSLKLAAGRRNRLYEGRALGIAALCSAALSLPACYCFPTAAALFVYGLRVYTGEAGRKAFRDV